MVLPRAPWLQTHLSAREGFDVAMCHEAPYLASQHERALASPRATWLSACYGPQAKGKYSVGLPTQPDPHAFEAYSCIPKTLDIRRIMTSPAMRSRQSIKCVQDSHMWCMGSIKCV
jgi:hypothetical protein